ncbi:MAG: YidC/Oxa1 family membrane protein insertase [Lachnospiraceae bacterium]|nr:YidC/Oxa1 family membrane protein insertase [Lachnospiraceae bacterium]
MYKLLIGPIEYLLRVLFFAFYHVTLNTHISLLALSLAVGFLTMPFYRQAEAMQEEERRKRDSMKEWEGKIRKVFRGEERSYMLQHYYRICGYKPAFALRTLFPLLLQIPFFLAAYNMLGAVEGIPGKLFTESDGLIRLGELRINCLPILMTVINLLSAFIYVKGKGLGLKEKLQMALLPLLFLVVLYPCPQAMVLYWTFNNAFSLVRNIVTRLGWQRIVKKICIGGGFLAGMYMYSVTTFAGCYVPEMDRDDTLASFVSVCIVMSYMIPALVVLFLKDKKIRLWRREAEDPGWGTMLIKEAVLFLLSAVFIITGIVEDSPTEFPIRHVGDLLPLMRIPLLSAAGTWFVWGNLIYILLDKKGRGIFGRLLGIGTILALADHFFWSNDHGILMANSRYEQTPLYGYQIVLPGIAIFLAAVILLLVLSDRLAKIDRAVTVLLLLSLVLVSGYRFVKIGDALASEARINEEAKSSTPFFTLSRSGQNVVLIMLDRAVGTFVPFIMQECPELKASFDGFTWYSDALSFAGHTNMGAPALFGGYEYSPYALEERSSESMESKHLEALQVLPTIFGEAGWQVSLADLPYADYTWGGDMSGFKKMKNTTAANLERRYSGGFFVADSDPDSYGRGFAEYSVFKLAPVFMQRFLYTDCGWDDVAMGGYLAFYKAYKVMSELPALTEIEDGDTNHYIEWDSNLTHESRQIQLPDYSFSLSMPVDNSTVDVPARLEAEGREMKYDSGGSRALFHVNVLSYKLLAEWLDLLKREGVYDNTRIIIVSDHGSEAGMFEDLILSEDVDVQRFNCLLMMKDFNAHGFTENKDFMTNADAPALLLDGVIENAKNPFSGADIRIKDPSEKEAIVTTSHGFHLSDTNSYDEPADSWYRVRGNIFDPENWSRIDR